MDPRFAIVGLLLLTAGCTAAPPPASPDPASPAGEDPTTPGDEGAQDPPSPSEEGTTGDPPPDDGLPSPEPPSEPEARWSQGSWRVQDCTFQDAAPDHVDPLPPIVAVAAPGDGVGTRLLRLSPDGGGYDTADEAEVAARQLQIIGRNEYGLAPWGSQTYLYATVDDAPALIRFDEALQETAILPTGPVAALEAQGGALWVGNRSLSSLDADLRVTGSIRLLEGSGSKMADGIHLHDGVAYVLDDVMAPLFVFRVDVRDPAQPAILERLDLSGGTLPLQWLEPEERQWIVLANAGGRAYTNQNVRIVDMDGDGQLRSVAAYHWQGDWQTGELRYISGFAILAATPEAPTWAFVWNGTEGSLGRVSVDEDAGTLGLCRYELPFPLEGQGRMHAGPVDLRRSGPYVVGHWGDQLVVVEERDGGPVLRYHGAPVEGLAAVRIG